MKMDKQDVISWFFARDLWALQKKYTFQLNKLRATCKECGNPDMSNEEIESLLGRAEGISCSDVTSSSDDDRETMPNAHKKVNKRKKVQRNHTKTDQKLKPKCFS